MSGTIFQSPSVHVAFDVNPLTNRGDQTPSASVCISWCIGRRMKVQKHRRTAANWAEIQKAKRARELGLAVEIPTPLPPSDYDYEEDEAEEVVADYQANLESSYFTPGQQQSPRRLVVKTADWVETWDIAEGWDDSGSGGWDNPHLDKEVRGLVPEPIAAFCDRLVAYLETEAVSRREALQAAERAQLRQDFGLP